MCLYLEKLKGLREDAEMTQTDIANLLHIAQTTYSQYERGVRAMPIEVLKQLADFYKVSTDWLLE